MTYQAKTNRLMNSTRVLALTLFTLCMAVAPAGLRAQAKPGETQAEKIAERVESQETESTDQEKLQKEVADAAKKAGENHPNDADAVKKAVKEKIDEITKRNSRGNKPGGGNNKEVREWAKKLKRELLDDGYLQTAAAATPGESEGEKIAERVEAEETNSSDQEKLAEEIAKAARDAGKANPNDPEAVKKAVKAKLDEIRDRTSTDGKPGGKKNKEVEEWVKKLKRTLMGSGYVSIVPPSGSRIVLTGTVVEGQEATLSVVDHNGATLEGIVVDVNDERYVTDENGRVVFIASGAAGVVAASMPALINSPAAVANVVSSFPATPTAPVMETVPAHVMDGDQVVITGSGFDGTASSNVVTVDGVGTQVLASSPSEVVVGLPEGTALGQHQLVVATGQGVSEPQSIKVIRLNVQSDSAVLLRGKKGKLQVTVSGTDERVPLRFVNKTPHIITMDKDNAADVLTSGGRDNHVTLNTRGVNPGSFQIAAEIMQEASR